MNLAQSMSPEKPTQPPGRNAVSRKRKRWLPYAGAIALLVLIVAGLWPEPVPVETSRVTVGKLQAAISEEGRTRVKQRYVVFAPVTGQVRRIELKPGAEVQADYTILAVIDPPRPVLLDARSRTQAEANRDTAHAHLEKAASALSFATNERGRFEKLFDQGAVSIQELEPLQWREAAAAREKAAAENALRSAEAELAVFASDEKPPRSSPVTEVRAPANGRVLRVPEESSRMVTAGTPLLEVGDPAELEVVVEVLSRDGATIPPEARVEFEQWGGGVPLEGRVRLIEPSGFTKVSALGVEEQRVNVIADLLTPPAQRPALGDNFRVDARIIVWETDQALKVPAGALFRQGDRWAAYVLHQGRAQLRSIQAGRSSATETQVLEGLKEGEEVILYPGDRVQAGRKVRRITI